MKPQSSSDIGRRVASRTRARRLGRPLVAVDTCASTMLLAKRLVRRGTPCGLAVIARSQTEGRGRVGRSFVSPPGGLYLTVVLEKLEPLDESWRLGFAAALSCRHAVRDCGGPRLDFVWPNDLFSDEGKVAGVLCELVSTRPGEQVVLVGIGVNVATPPGALDGAGPAAALPPLDDPDPLAALAATLLENLEELDLRLRRPGGWDAALESIREAMQRRIGRPLAVRRADGSVLRGLCAGIRRDGSLLVETREGEIVPVRYAERLEL